MNGIWIYGLTFAWLVVIAGCWLGWQLIRQNGRILLRLDEIEKRLEELEFGEQGGGRREEAPEQNSEVRSQKSEEDQSLVTSAATSRFGNRSLARSGIKRDGLKAGTAAPSFRLPRHDGGELSLEELRGRRVLLVFSDPHCGPCNALAPELEKFHRETLTLGPSPIGWERATAGEGEAAPIQVVMISRGEPKENRRKVKEHGLTFLIVLQRQWEISRLYAMFATPVAYLIGEEGLITEDVAVGVDLIRALIRKAAHRENSHSMLDKKAEMC